MISAYPTELAREAYVPGNGYGVLAAGDRDLIAEADDTEACTDTALEVQCAMYPPIYLAAGTFIRPMDN